MSKKMEQRRSAGVVALTRTGETQTAIARRLCVTRSVIAKIMAGNRAPTAEVRVSAERVYRIPIEAWEQPAGATPRPRVPRATKPPTAQPPAAPTPPTAKGVPDPPAERTLATRVAELQLHVDELLEEVRGGGPGKGGGTETSSEQAMTPLERGRVLASVAATMTTIGKLTGESLVISERKILSLPGWRRVESTLIEALTPWPEAMHAAGQALSDLDNAP